MPRSAAPRIVPAAVDEFAGDVRYYLTLRPRQLPSRYLYDALGSALFEAICALPWYRVTRAELALLEQHARDIFARAGGLSRVVELGSGSGEKLATLIARGGAVPASIDVHLVDISMSALEQASRALAALGVVSIVPHETTYEAGLEEVRRLRIPGRTLALFLGSNIGNFDPPGADAFLRSIRAALAPRDLLLIGADLVKPERELLLAYDDPLGVTAAFNRNLLVRINRELQGDFDLGRFGHRAVWNAAESRVEMHLVSLAAQRVRVPGAGVDFTMREGETIWTESSYKYDPDRLAVTLAAAGFRPVRQWVHDEDRFALTLAAAC
ncbi:MAG: L-histidine N(alpha)-methyltransferase [Betaproteobacteria bacterium]